MQETARQHIPSTAKHCATLGTLCHSTQVRSEIDWWLNLCPSLCVLHACQRPRQDVSLPRKIVFSGLSGAIATTCIYPLDLTKTKLMNQKGIGAAREFKGPLHTFQTIWAREGIRGMYRGWSV